MKRWMTTPVLVLGLGLLLPRVIQADELPKHQVPASKDGDLVVGMCDGETFLEVDGVKDGSAITPQQGQQISDALMKEWKKKNPDARWETVVAQAPTQPKQPVVQQGPTAGSSPDQVAKSKANVQSGHTYGAFSARDEKLWKASLDDAVAEGRAVFHDAAKLGGTVAISCDMCHPDASNTHPETYPKFQVQLGRVAMLRDMINWCIENPVRGKPMAEEDPRMKAMEAYIYAQRAGKVLEPGKH